MKKILLFAVLFNLFFNIIAQEAGLDPIKERRFNRGIGITLDDNSPVFAVTMSRIENLSNDILNKRNFGKYVEMIFNYHENGKVIEVHMVYSNLKSINVEINDIVLSGNVIGYSGGNGTQINQNNDLYIYIYTTEDCQNLRQLTNSSFIIDEGVYWWNPMFLYSQRD